MNTPQIIILTIFGVIAVQSLVRYLCTIDPGESDVLDRIQDAAYALCQRWELALPEPKPREDMPGLDRYPEDGTNPFHQFVTKIVVPDEYSRVQVMLALRHIHDTFEIDTDYMAVNTLAHLYADETGEPTGMTPWIVVEPEVPFKERVERAGMALEKSRTSGYEWTPEQFDIWWNRDPDFTQRTTAWPDGFRGTRKGHVLHEAEVVLKAVES